VADWGQVELLIIAHYSKDPALFEAFTKGQDPHSMTAKVLFNLPCEVNEVKNKYPNQRQIAKTINFAIAFGAGDKKLAVSAGVSLDEAKNFSEMHRVEFKDIYKFKRDTIAACRSRKPPYVETLLGRKRRLPGINAREEKIRWANERQAVNSRIQGTQADLMKIAMSSFYKMTKQTEPGINLSLIVHDEQVVTCPDDRIEEGVELVRNAMTGTEVQQYLSLPLKLDLKVVKEWGSAK
jgi:DNA polymerase I-like protein with 3'-5' exonuclease and polymerase domains